MSTQILALSRRSDIFPYLGDIGSTLDLPFCSSLDRLASIRFGLCFLRAILHMRRRLPSSIGGLVVKLAVANRDF